MGRHSSDPKAQALIRRERFLRVATVRTQKVLYDLEALGKCSRREMYDYSPEDVEKILAALQKGIDNVHQSFQEGRHSFSLMSDDNKNNEV